MPSLAKAWWPLSNIIISSALQILRLPHLTTWQFQKHHIRKKEQETELPSYWEKTRRLHQYHISRLYLQEQKPGIKTSSQDSLSEFAHIPLLSMCTFALINLALSCLLFILRLNSFSQHKTKTWSPEYQALSQHLKPKDGLLCEGISCPLRTDAQVSLVKDQTTKHQT